MSSMTPRYCTVRSCASRTAKAFTRTYTAVPSGRRRVCSWLRAAPCCCICRVNSSYCSAEKHTWERMSAWRSSSRLLYPSIRTSASFTSTKRPSGVEKYTFLNVVEQFAVAALGLAAVGDVFQHVDGLQALAGGAMHPRSGHDVGAVEHRQHVLVGSGVIVERTAEGAGVSRGFIVRHHQTAHADANEFLGLDSDEVGQRAVHA